MGVVVGVVGEVGWWVVGGGVGVGWGVGVGALVLFVLTNWKGMTHGSLPFPDVANVYLIWNI